MKVVINVQYGGFDLSPDALNEYCIRKGLNEVSAYDIARDDEDLIDIIEKMGDKAAGAYCVLKIVDIPDDVKWTIQQYDGNEWVAEVHRTWM